MHRIVISVSLKRQSYLHTQKTLDLFVNFLVVLQMRQHSLPLTVIMVIIIVQ